MIKKLTEQQYLQFLDSDPKIIKDYKEKGITIIVTENVVLPRYLENLPEVPTVFEQKLDATKSSLKYFNHEVKGSASFVNLKTLCEIGKSAIFHNHLLLNGSNIKTFDNIVKGMCNLNGSAIEEIGSNTEIGADLYCERSNLKKFDGRVMGGVSL